MNARQTKCNSLMIISFFLHVSTVPESFYGNLSNQKSWLEP